MQNQSLLLVSITDRARQEDQDAVSRIKKELKSMGALEVNEASYLLFGDHEKVDLVLFSKAQAKKDFAVRVYSLSALVGEQSALQPKIRKLAKEHLKAELNRLGEEL